MYFIRCIVTLVLITACTSGTDKGHSFQIYEENGVSIAETIDGPLYQEPLFRFEVKLTLQEDPNNPESMLFRPGTIRRDDDGLFFVLDRGDCRIAVFDQHGQYLRSFGRKGEGPGEFIGMNVLRFTGDVMTIYDYSLRRTTCYKTDGTLLEVYKAPGVGSSGGSIERMADGGFILYPRPDYSLEPNDPIIDHSAERIVVTNVSGDTLCDLTTPFIPWGYEYQLEIGGGAHRMEFVGNPQLLYFPDRGILSSTGLESVLTWYDLQGKTNKIIKLGLVAEPVTAEDREQIRQAARDDYESSKEQRPDHAKAVLDALQIPDSKALWDNVYMDDAGFYWLRVAVRFSGRQAGEGILFYVLSPEGEYLGQSRWPTGYGTFKEDLFMGMVSDNETGSIIPTVFQVIPIVEGLKYPYR